MAEEAKRIYKSILGGAKETIDAIQHFLEKNPPRRRENLEEAPAESINRVISSIQNEDTVCDIEKIIRNL